MAHFNLCMSIFAIPAQGERNNLVSDFAQHVKTVEPLNVVAGADGDRCRLGWLRS
jgi:hypothetical protein